MASGIMPSPFPTITTYGNSAVTYNSDLVNSNPDNQFQAHKFGKLVLIEGGVQIKANVASSAGTVFAELPTELAPAYIGRGWFMNTGGSFVRYGGVQMYNGKPIIYMNAPNFSSSPYMMYKIVYIAQNP